MNLKSIMFLIALCILDRVLAKKRPVFTKNWICLSTFYSVCSQRSIAAS